MTDAPSMPRQPSEFYIGDLQAPLDAAKRGKRRMGIATIGFLSILLVSFAGALVSLLIQHSTSALKLGTASFMIVALIAGLTIAVPGTMVRRDGAVKLMISQTGFELQYPGGSIQTVSWTGRRGSFDLYDWSNRPTAMLAGPVPFTIVVERVESNLSRDAYQALLSASRAHGLEERKWQARTAIYSGGDYRPTVHTFKTRPAAT